MDTVGKLLAKKLLGISAVKLQPKNPFTWASGWKSPIYTDNRKTLSYPDVRTFVKVELTRLIAEKFGDFDVIAGVATGAIAQGALIADELGMPYVYIRSAAKDHGMGNLIEGDIKPGQKVVVVEDLISTGGSCIEVVDALREAGAEVLGIVSIFTYGMKRGVERIAAANTVNYSLSNLDALVEVAAEEGYIAPEWKERILAFRDNPSDESWIK